MIKLCGAILILAAGGMLGCLPLMGMRERIRVLETFAEELMRMKAELTTYGMSIPELMKGIGDAGPFSSVSVCMAQNGAMSFSNSWKNCVMQNGERLTAQERHAVAGLGDILGRYALEVQIASLDGVAALLMQGKEETKNRLRGVSRLYMGTSLSLSAMLVILLI